MNLTSHYGLLATILVIALSFHLSNADEGKDDIYQADLKIHFSKPKKGESNTLTYLFVDSKGWFSTLKGLRISDKDMKLLFKGEKGQKEFYFSLRVKQAEKTSTTVLFRVLKKLQKYAPDDAEVIVYLSLSR